MSEEIEALAGVDPAPVPETTAVSVPVENAPEVTDSGDSDVPAVKSFTQEELDEAIGKRLARERRKWEREQAAKTPPIELDSEVQYDAATVMQKAKELVKHEREQEEAARIAEAYYEKEEVARGKYADFEQVAYNNRVPITPVMAEVIRASDVGPDIAYHLGVNVKEADRISRLPDFLQAKEIGRIEAKLAATPPVKKSTSAPAPVNPVTARSANTPSYDTTDPRSVVSMSTSQWIEAERQRQIRKWQAQPTR